MQYRAKCPGRLPINAWAGSESASTVYTVSQSQSLFIISNSFFMNIIFKIRDVGKRERCNVVT